MTECGSGVYQSGREAKARNIVDSFLLSMIHFLIHSVEFE